jgi:hypothetical protein
LTDGKTAFTWTEKRIELAKLVAEGKEFMEIVDLGYSLNMTSKVVNALKAGEKPPGAEVAGEVAVEGDEGKGDKSKEAGKPLVTVTGPKTSPIVFFFEQKKIALDPFELHAQYRYFTDLANRNGGITESFSEVLTLGMQVLWVLHQNIPLKTEMLKAVFTGYK